MSNFRIFNPHSYLLPEDLNSYFGDLYSVMIKKFSLPRYEIEISFINPDEIRKLNKLYRRKDKETDVLSFPMLTHPSENFLGAIYFCYPVVLENNSDILYELSFLFVHSFLHLLGYEHGEEMFRLKAEVMSEVFKV